jgi:hypothetical protein
LSKSGAQWQFPRGTCRKELTQKHFCSGHELPLLGGWKAFSLKIHANQVADSGFALMPECGTITWV